MQCEGLGDALAGVVDRSQTYDRVAEAHVDHCLRCQAELVQYRKLLRALHSLRAELVDPGPGLLTDVLDAVEAAGERHMIRMVLQGRRAAYLGGVAVATAGAAATAAVLVSRSRRGRLGIAS
ncbi:MAG TPA: hypothetical protein VHA73_09960 [Acidimicrobiales bacterium]|jgi:hypothetical protein|nr:hypothetical protein [Acidimicrobiales bacterium]